MSWIVESNRMKHLLYAIPIALIGTFIMIIGVAFGLEFKDKQYGNQFDWLDILATLIGGVIGQLIQLLIICWIF